MPDPDTFEIMKYDVSHYAGGKNTNKYPYRAIIGLRRSDDSLIGAAYFHIDPSTLPDTDQRNPAGYISCHYPAEALPHVLDILRNEKPVFVRFIGGSWNIASIVTSMEPVGEGEPAS